MQFKFVHQTPSFEHTQYVLVMPTNSAADIAVFDEYCTDMAIFPQVISCHFIEYQQVSAVD